MVLHVQLYMTVLGMIGRRRLLVVAAAGKEIVIARSSSGIWRFNHIIIVGVRRR